MATNSSVAEKYKWTGLTSNWECIERNLKDKTETELKLKIPTATALVQSPLYAAVWVAICSQLNFTLWALLIYLLFCNSSNWLPLYWSYFIQLNGVTISSVNKIDLKFYKDQAVGWKRHFTCHKNIRTNGMNQHQWCLHLTSFWIAGHFHFCSAAVPHSPTKGRTSSYS